MSRRRCILTFAAASLLSGCGAWQAMGDSSAAAYKAVFQRRIKVLKVDLIARAQLNPDSRQRACSVAVRIYQLKDRARFDSLSYDDLLTNDKRLLKDDLRETMAEIVRPSASLSLTQPMHDDTRYVAIVAFWQKPDAGEVWRRVISRDALDAKQPLKIELRDQALIIAGTRTEQ